MKLPFNQYWCYAILVMASLLNYPVIYRNGKVFFDNGRETFFFLDKDPVVIADYLKREGGFKHFPEENKSARRRFKVMVKRVEKIIVNTRNYKTV